MGLFSLIKNIYYNNKLNKAIRLTTVKDFSQAEAIFIELIPKHPEAVTELAKMYLNQAQGQSDLLKHYQKILNCESRLLNSVSNRVSFKVTKNNTLSLIYHQFKDNYSKGSYKKSLEFSGVLLNYKKEDSFIKEHYKCLFDYAISLTDVNGNGNDTDPLLIQIYNECQRKIFLSEIFNNTIYQIFERAKQYSANKNYECSNKLCAIIFEEIIESKYLFIENDIVNIENVKTKDNDAQKLIDTIGSIEDKFIALKYLERLIGHLNDAKLMFSKYIVELSSELIKNKKYKDSIDLLENAISIYNASLFTEQLIIISNSFINEASYNSACELLKNLVSKHSDAEPLLAKCYWKLSAVEKSNDSKKDLLLKSFEFKNSHNKLFNAKLYDQIFHDVISSLIEVAYKYGEFSYYSDAYALLDLVLFYKPISLNTFIKVKVLEINNISKLEKQITLYKEAIEVTKQKVSGLADVKEIQLDILYIELINANLKKFTNSDNETAIHGLLTLKNEVEKQIFHSTNINQSINKLDITLAEKYFNKGFELENKNQLEDALNSYDIINEHFTIVTEIYNLSLLRIQIVYFKNVSLFKSKINNKNIDELLRTQKTNKVVIDLAYRFAIYLINNEDLNQAMDVIDNYLPSNSNNVALLKDLCKSAEIKKAKNILCELNSKIEKINNSELVIGEAIQIISNIEAIEKECSILKDIEGKIVDLKASLIDYVIFKPFETENYVESFNYIKKYRNNYINDDVLFRNIAISSFGIIATGEMNENNYKELISIWVTATFNVKLFIHSLNYTSWDDKFTFSLQNSLGLLLQEELENIPDNVNYDDISSTNISIGEVQKSLLDIVENVIAKDSYDDDFKVVCLDFLHEEINAVTSFYGLALDDQIIGCTPYFAKQNNQLFERISESLTNELQFSDVNTEDVLKVGLLYSINIKQFKSYSDAIILKNKALEVVKAKNYSQVKLIFSKQNLNKLENYTELYSSLFNELRDVFKEQIKDEMDFEKTLTNYLVICQAYSDSNLNYIVSNSANRICVSMLNDETLSKNNGLKILSDVYRVIKNNDKLNENIQAIINAAIIDIIIEDDRTLKNVLFIAVENSPGAFDRGIIDTLNQAIEIIVISGKIHELTSFISDFNKISTFNVALNNVVSKAKDIQITFELSKIIDQLNSSSISEIVGLERTYELYETNKNNSRVCENLVILCGNLIHSNVLKQTRSTNRITAILDTLIRNRSAVFIQCAVQLSSQRDEILNSLPYDARTLMAGMSFPGQSLTTEGEALRKGLNYLKQLSN